MRRTILLLFLANHSTAFGLEYSKAIDLIEKHEQVLILKEKELSYLKKASMESSWGDLNLKLSAKNYPVEALSLNKSPMSGIEIGINQKIPLSTKYGKRKKAELALAKSSEYLRNGKKNELIKDFWLALIRKREIQGERELLLESHGWIKKILKISKKLYATGKLSQQAVLGVQIRKIEIENKIDNVNFEKNKVTEEIGYILGIEVDDVSGIPWRSLEDFSKVREDSLENAYREKIKSSNYLLAASRLARIPDAKLSLTYTKREYDDNLGDFVSASIQLALPTSGRRHAAVEFNLHKKTITEKKLFDYQKKKKLKISGIQLEIEKNKNEISQINNRSINFAINSRDITSKSYGLGSVTYNELLQSELNLQKILFRKNKLESKLAIAQIELKYISGVTFCE